VAPQVLDAVLGVNADFGQVAAGLHERSMAALNRRHHLLSGAITDLAASLPTHLHDVLVVPTVRRRHPSVNDLITQDANPFPSASDRADMLSV